MKLLLLRILAVVSFGCFLYGLVLFVVNDFTFKTNNPSLLFIISTFLTGVALVIGILRTKKAIE